MPRTNNTGRIQQTKFLGTIYLDTLLDDDYCEWTIPERARTSFRRACWSHEICPSTGRHHIQIYVETRERISYAQLDRLLGAHISCKEVWSAQGAWDYCSERKEKDAESRHGCPSKSIGERPRGDRESRGGGGGERDKQLAEIGARILHGDPLGLIMRDFIPMFIRHPAGIRFVASLVAATNTPDEWQPTQLHIIHGGTGVGKSRWVRSYCATHSLSLWVQPVNSRGLWYDGYDHHAAALFDDFDGDMPFRDMLRITEGYRVQVPVKGGFVSWHPRVVFITSDVWHGLWSWPKGKERVFLSEGEEAQLVRRITSETRFSRPETFRGGPARRQEEQETVNPDDLVMPLIDENTPPEC